MEEGESYSLVKGFVTKGYLFKYYIIVVCIHRVFYMLEQSNKYNPARTVSSLGNSNPLLVLHAICVFCPQIDKIMQNISKKLSADFNLFSLNDPETTRFYTANIDFLINNFPYFKDISLVASFFSSDNKKFNAKFYTRITKFVEIIQYDCELASRKTAGSRIKGKDTSNRSLNGDGGKIADCSNHLINERSGGIAEDSDNVVVENMQQKGDPGSHLANERSEATDLRRPQDGRGTEKHNFHILQNTVSAISLSPRLSRTSSKHSSLDSSKRSPQTPSYFAQFLKETDSRPFTVDSDSDSELESVQGDDSGESPEVKNLSSLPPEIQKLKNELRICKDKRSSSLIEIKSDPLFPNHGPVGEDFVSNPTRFVLKHYASVLNFHIGNFLVTPFFINQLVSRSEYEEIADLLCKLVKHGGVLEILAKSTNLKQIFLKNLGVLEMIFESSANCELGVLDEDLLIEQVYSQRASLIYRFFEDGILQGYIGGDIDFQMGNSSAIEAIGVDSQEADASKLACIGDVAGAGDKVGANEADTNTAVETGMAKDTGTINKDGGEVNGADASRHINNMNGKADAANKTNMSEDATGKDKIGTEKENFYEEIKNVFEKLSLIKKSENPPAIVFPAAFTILQAVCIQKSGISIPEIKFGEINRFSLFYYRLLSYNDTKLLEGKSNEGSLLGNSKSIQMESSGTGQIENSGIAKDPVSHEMLVFLQELFFSHVQCSHLLFSITKILLKTSPRSLAKVGFFERLRVAAFLYARAHATTGIEDSLFAFLIKIYVKFKEFLEGAYLDGTGMDTSNSVNSASWVAAHQIFEYFLRLERFGYVPEDEENILEYEGFSRFVIDSFISDLPFSTVFTKY